MNETTAIESSHKTSLVNRLIGVISAIFTPYIGILAGAGILMALNTLLQKMAIISTESFISVILTAVSSGVFTLLPVFIGITTAKVFNSNVYIGVALATALLFPLTAAEMPETIHLFGLSLGVKSYGGAVIPTILAVFVAGYIERFFKKIVPAVAEIVVVPALTLLVAGFVTFLVIGPLGMALGSGISWIYGQAYGFSPLVAGVLLGALFPFTFVFGIHWSILPVAMINIQSLGYDTILPIMMMAVFGQFGAAAGMVRHVSKADRALTVSTLIPAFFGITEPAIYGVNLKYGKPFISGVIASALGGGLISFLGVKIFQFTPILSALYYPLFIGPDSSMRLGILSSVITFVIAFLGSFIFGKIKQTNN
ncbi:PTS transporter subunit EIIC [Vagococcus intermedius]|uniref:PTS transporter subunit EIIC n=1 Tax=Vagococcus intermedius TaxID=2991418 RepID=A0AAF0CW91_9ENTE|nr:PTS transporter subunit EIIC [Vagococcus intermedius]WEG73986.1 PTS transporter subunit EIIC [Vagococcus intermedius]WEG76066.1 PTS transporter subunit EIIC [Vagococcus intermedius]